MIICKRPAPLDDHLQEAGSPYDHLQPRKEHETPIFETLYNEIKCVLSIKESNFDGKKWVTIFIFAYGQGQY